MRHIHIAKPHGLLHIHAASLNHFALALVLLLLIPNQPLGDARQNIRQLSFLKVCTRNHECADCIYTTTCRWLQFPNKWEKQDNFQNMVCTTAKNLNLFAILYNQIVFFTVRFTRILESIKFSRD